MDVSVVTVTRNTCALTCAAIQSVFDSQDSLTKEIIVVDNGSTDETPTVVPRKFPGVHYLRAETDLGLPRACNMAATQAKGEFILQLNSDARLTPDALGLAVAWMRRHPDCAAVGAQLLNPDGSRQNSIANFPTLTTELVNKSLLRRLWPDKFPGKERQFSGPVEVESVVGAFMLIRKTTWDALDGWDERYFFFFEETDFCRRARQRGQLTFHLPNVRAWHAQGQTAKQISIGARIEFWRSRYLYFSKHHARSIRLLLKVGLLFRLFFNWLAAGLMNLATLGRNERWQNRWQVCSALVGWHLHGRPAEGGLPR